jgi:hypothetical protein
MRPVSCTGLLTNPPIDPVVSLYSVTVLLRLNVEAALEQFMASSQTASLPQCTVSTEFYPRADLKQIGLPVAGLSYPGDS